MKDVAAWAHALGLAEITGPGLFYRLREAEGWLQRVLAQTLQSQVESAVGSPLGPVWGPPCNGDPTGCVAPPSPFPWWIITGAVPPFIVSTTSWSNKPHSGSPGLAAGGDLLGTLGQLFRGRPPGMSFGDCVSQNIHLLNNATTSTSPTLAVASGSVGIVGSILTFGSVGGGTLTSGALTVAGFLAGAPVPLTAGAVVISEPIVALFAGAGLGAFLGSAANCASQGVLP